jgi:hypothetical protein
MWRQLSFPVVAAAVRTGVVVVVVVVDTLLISGLPQLHTRFTLGLVEHLAMATMVAGVWLSIIMRGAAAAVVMY